MITVFGSAGAFLDPVLSEDAFNTWKDQLKKVVAEAKAELQRKAALIRFGEMQWAEGPQIPEGGRYTRPSKPTFAGMMASYNRRREFIAQKQLALAQNETGKAKRELAEKYRAYLAASLVLWCGVRRGNVRQLRWKGRWRE